jgi:inositol phosphorylceramide mannosyltransferase catalytic subunit
MIHALLFLFVLFINQLITTPTQTISLSFFDISMSNHTTPGKLDPKLYNTQDLIQWHILRTLFNQRNLTKVHPSEQPLIPKIIHHIWLGSKIPSCFQHYIQSWKKHHPSWEHKLWTDTEVASLGLRNQKLFDEAKNYGEKADIARYEILNRYGGLYVDIDIECLRPFDIFHHCYQLYVGIEQAQRLEINNALIGAVPGHPLLNLCIESMSDEGDKYDCMAIMKRSGPIHFTKCFMEIASLYDMMIAFPVSYFYPIPIEIQRYTMLQQVRKYIRSETYTIHYWASSWTLPQGFVV